MRKTLTLLAILICTTTLFAQNITYDLRWSAASSLYELYVTRDITAVTPVTTGATSSVTIVFPTDGSGTRTVAHTSESVSSYNAAGVIRNPGASTANDFYVFNSTGGSSYVGVLNANVEVLWMTFLPSDGNSGARLFMNDSDPNSDADGMMSINARSEFNVITTAGVNDEFNMNVLNVEDSYRLSEISIYPNPASNILNILGNTASIDKIDVFSITGQQIKSLASNFERIDVEAIESGVYFLKISNNNQQKIIKFIKE